LSGVLLGFTSILFLLAVVCTYAVVDVFGDIAPKTIKELNDAPATGPSINPHDLKAIEAGTIPSIDTDDVWRIDKAFFIYERSSRLLPLGLVLTFITVPVVAFHVHWVVGVLTVLLMALSLWVLRRVFSAMQHRRPTRRDVK